ncbi:MAG: diguanylate cyclase (GGDEF)-like protein [Myxococcota bacterium]|jgi:diguanylate cyclase (GGDEF)-like protein
MAARLIVYADFNCPYCFALSERLLEMGEADRVVWRSIEHMPTTTSAQRTMEVQSLLSAEVSALRRRIPSLDVSTPAFRASSGPANHLLQALSGATPEALLRLRVGIYRAYWQDGLDIEDEDVLHELVGQSGVVAAMAGLEVVTRQLQAWQDEWEVSRYHQRIPVLLESGADCYILGLPAYTVVQDFLQGREIDPSAQGALTCRKQDRQEILIIGEDAEVLCDTTELESLCLIHRCADFAGVLDRVAKISPDVVVLIARRHRQDALRLSVRIRSVPALRELAIIVLISPGEPDAELVAFDAGATDVVQSLSNAKICQVRLGLHLRARRRACLLESMARRDYLTGLPNRQEAERLIEHAWSQGRYREPLSVVLLDIDYFKQYNDTYGHPQGDDCLRQVSTALFSVAERLGGIAARWGGEEFLVTFPQMSSADAWSAAESMRTAIASLGLPHSGSLVAKHVTVSLGVATAIPCSTLSPGELIGHSDDALYEAKSTGRNRTCVHLKLIEKAG